MTRLKTALCELTASFLVWNLAESASTQTTTAAADFTTSIWNEVASEAESRTTFKIQPVIPYGLWIPNTAGPQRLRDLGPFEAAPIPVGEARLVLGPALGFSGRDSSQPAKFALGPAAGFVVPLSSVVTAGLFTQSLFSERARLTQLQPILAYQLGAGWSVSAGDLQFTIDWAKARWSKIPIGLQLGVVCPVFEQPIRFFVSPQYNLKDMPGTDRFKVLIGFALLVTGAGHN